MLLKLASNSQRSSYLRFAARTTGLSHHAQRILILETSITLSFVTENCVSNLHYPSRLDIHLHPQAPETGQPGNLEADPSSRLQDLRAQWKTKQTTPGPLCWLRFILRGPSGRGQRTRRRGRQRASAGRFTARTRTPTAPGAARRRGPPHARRPEGRERAAEQPLGLSHGRLVADSPRKHEVHAGRPSPGPAGAPRPAYGQRPGHSPAPRRPAARKTSARYLTLRAGPRAGASATVVDFGRHPDATLASTL